MPTAHSNMPTESISWNNRSRGLHAMLLLNRSSLTASSPVGRYVLYIYVLEIWRLAGSRWLGTCYMLGAWFGPSRGWKMEAKHRATRLGAELAVLRIDYSSIPLGPLYSSWSAIIQNFEVIHWLIDAYVVCSTLWSLTGETSITRPTPRGKVQ